MSQDEVTESPDLWQEVFDEAIGEELHKVLKTQDVFYLVVNCMKNGLIDFSNLILWNISKFQESSRGSDGL